MAKKRKIPKKIAGIKVPKMLRKSGLMRMLLANQTGRDILANAITAAAGAAAGVLIEHREEVAHAGGDALKAGARGAEAGASKAARASKLAAHAARSAVGAFADAVTDAAHGLVTGDKKASNRRDDDGRDAKRAKPRDGKDRRTKAERAADRADFLTH